MTELTPEADAMIVDFKSRFQRNPIYDGLTTEQICKAEVTLIEFLAGSILAQHPEMRDDIRAAVNRAWRVAPQIASGLRQVLGERVQ